MEGCGLGFLRMMVWESCKFHQCVLSISDIFDQKHEMREEKRNQLNFYPLAVNMELVGYELGVVLLGVPERKGLLQASRRTITEGKEVVMFVDPGFLYSLFLICVLFSFSLECTPRVLAISFS